MKVQQSTRSGKVAFVDITIGETRYRISEEMQGHLEITKTNFEDSELRIIPRVSNQIWIK